MRSESQPRKNEHPPCQMPAASRARLIVISQWPSFLAFAVLVAVTLSGWTFRAIERRIITGLYSEEAWDAGLRVVGKPLRLSNGEELPGAAKELLSAGSWALSVGVFVGTVLVLETIRFVTRRILSPESRRSHLG